MMLDPSPGFDQRRTGSASGRSAAGPTPKTGPEETAARMLASEAIAAQLRRAILEGTHEFGDKLAPERDLARVFDVSRTTVRNALHQLEAAGLVVRRVGSGTYVSYRPVPEIGDIAEVTSPLELIEVRLALEPPMVRMAVACATARDLDRLREALERVEAAGDDPESFSRCDEDFHLHLAECTHNPLMTWIYREINQVRGHSQWDLSKDTILTPERIARYNRQHRRLYDTLCSRNVEASARAITAHLESARIDLLGGKIDTTPAVAEGARR